MKGYVSKRYLSEKFDVLKRELFILTLGYDDEVEQRNLERAGALAPICSQAAAYFGDLEINGELYDTCAGYATIQNGLRTECKRCKAYVWNAREKN